MQVNGAVNASQFFSEVITVTLPNNQTDTVLVKTFTNDENAILFICAVPSIDISSLHYFGYIRKVPPNTVAPQLFTRQGYVITGGTNNELRIRADLVSAENTQVTITLTYLQRIST